MKKEATAKNYYKAKKRPLMLLEVMIAFALVVLCVFPLITPHVGMLKAERQFIRKVELDHAVNLLYASILEKLYLNSISWNELLHNQFPIVQEDLQRLGSASLNYEGSYNFNAEPPRFKPRDPNAPYSLYLFPLTISVTPSEFSQKSPEIKKANSLTYHYKVFVVKDGRSEKNPV